MSSTSLVTIKQQVKGLPEGGSVTAEKVLRNSTGVRISLDTTIGTGISSATTVAAPVNARFMVITPYSTNTSPIYLSGSTSETGIPLSSVDQSVLSIYTTSTGGTTFYLYVQTTRSPQCRVQFL